MEEIRNIKFNRIMSQKVNRSWNVDYRNNYNWEKITRR